MALRKKGKWWYGDSIVDIRDELVRQGRLNEYVPTHFADPKCQCGSSTFRLRVDDEQGAAVRICAGCSDGARDGRQRRVSRRGGAGAGGVRLRKKRFESAWASHSTKQRRRAMALHRLPLPGVWAGWLLRRLEE